MGLEIDPVTETEAVEKILVTSGEGRGGYVVTPNLDHIRLYQKDPAVRDVVANADLVLADGVPVVWACRLQGTPLPGRVPGSDLIFALCAGAAETGASVYLLGGTPGTALSAAAELARRLPGLRIVGTRCPPMGFEQNLDEMTAIDEELRRLNPQIVILGLPFPRSAFLSRIWLERLPHAWFLGLGISLSFVTGEVRRAPALMQRLGLEWMHRLAQEPRRLARRYLVDNLPFAARLGQHALRQRLKRTISR
jgi:N-acetylglucosaminyldiphosphoundecaprenol N-acetyl-beta-D-mannosaminyltransferase